MQSQHFAIGSISLKTDIPANHQVRLTLPEDIPIGPAEIVLVVVPQEEHPTSTLGDLLESELFGIWKDRTDIGDSIEFARQLREESWKRSA